MSWNQTVIEREIEIQQRSIKRSMKAIEEIEKRVEAYLRDSKDCGIRIMSGNLHSYANQIELEEITLKKCNEVIHVLSAILDSLGQDEG